MISISHSLQCFKTGTVELLVQLAINLRVTDNCKEYVKR